ncbi:MAG: hypothetical protein HY731_15580 [Candidatus Tectomicrobia bacterium]|nr:hypothetical protein [Candidatus Tectomicrobia bacterium]
MDKTTEKRSLAGYALLISGFLTCPCHLPIYLAILGGTTLGGLVMKNLLLVGMGMTLYFLIALVLGWTLISAKRAKSGVETKEVSRKF